MDKPLQTPHTFKDLLVKIAGTPVLWIRQRIVQVRSPGSWSGNLTSTELAGSQSEEDRLKHEAGWGRLWPGLHHIDWGSNPHLVCWAHLGTCYCQPEPLLPEWLQRSKQYLKYSKRSSRDAGNGSCTVAGLLDNSSSAQTMLNAKAS